MLQLCKLIYSNQFRTSLAKIHLWDPFSLVTTQNLGTTCTFNVNPLLFLLMSVEHRDNSGAVGLIAIIAEGIVSAAESWKRPCLLLLHQDYKRWWLRWGEKEEGAEKWRREWQREQREEGERLNEERGIKGRFNNIFEIRKPLECVFLFSCAPQGTFFFCLLSSVMLEDECTDAQTHTHTCIQRHLHRCKNTQKIKRARAHTYNALSSRPHSD